MASVKDRQTPSEITNQIFERLQSEFPAATVDLDLDEDSVTLTLTADHNIEIIAIESRVVIIQDGNAHPNHKTFVWWEIEGIDALTEVLRQWITE